MLSLIVNGDSAVVPLPVLAAATVVFLTSLLYLSYSYMTSSAPAASEKIQPIILGIATGNPQYKVEQTRALEIAKAAQGIDSVRPILDRVYLNTKIARRHLGVPDFSPELMATGDSLLFKGDGSFVLDVEHRLARFRQIAVPLVTRVAKEAMANAGITADQIGKLVVVSSTGFLGPGLDCELINNLGLDRTVDRSLIGFMGCAAAMNGFRVANDYVKTRPDATHPNNKALLVCVEVSSVHTTFDDTVNDAILHAIFADGCAAAVIGGVTQSKAKKGTIAIVDDYAYLCENTEDGITLAINANGISCTLSKHLPSYIKKYMGGYVDTFLGRQGLKRSDVDFWCVHPGGTRILESVMASVGLTEEQTNDSWEVLKEYGNMLSPSIMYVLARVFKRHEAALAAGEKGYNCGLAFSFSPGVGVEGILLRRIA